MGKTTVSNMFRDLGVQVWCADNEVNELNKINGAATKILFKEFPSVVTKTGVDKKKLKNLIHKDNAILKKVEQIVHPLLEHSKVDFIRSYGDLPLIVFDIPYALSANDDDKLLLATMMENARNNWSVGGDNVDNLFAAIAIMLMLTVIPNMMFNAWRIRKEQREMGH